MKIEVILFILSIPVYFHISSSCRVRTTAHENRYFQDSEAKNLHAGIKMLQSQGPKGGPTAPSA